MAVKDFKKTRSDKYAQVWLHKKKKIGISVQLSDGGLRKGYVVYFGNINNAGAKNFKTKSEALKFTKKYLKRN